MLHDESWIALVLEKDFTRRHKLLEAFMANLDSTSIRELVSEAGRTESEEGQLAGEILFYLHYRCDSRLINDHESMSAWIRYLEEGLRTRSSQPPSQLTKSSKQALTEVLYLDAGIVFPVNGGARVHLGPGPIEYRLGFGAVWRTDSGDDSERVDVTLDVKAGNDRFLRLNRSIGADEILEMLRHGRVTWRGELQTVVPGLMARTDRRESLAVATQAAGFGIATCYYTKYLHVPIDLMIREGHQVSPTYRTADRIVIRIAPHPWAAQGHTPSPEVFSEIAEFGRFVLFPNFLRITWHTPPVPAFETVYGPLETSSDNVRVLRDEIDRS